MGTYAPIILFVYNRPEHTKQTVEALMRNRLAAESELYIFADGTKEGASADQCNRMRQVREYISSITGFKDVHIEVSEKNKGLANSVIYGVTKVVNEHGKVIVLEDDIVTSSHFLEYMNQSLDLYEKDEDVVCVHGYSIIKDAPIKEKTYFQYGADCWGWATWKRGWEIFESDTQKLMDTIKADRTLLRMFTYNGTYPYLEMLLAQIDGKIDSWAVRWYASAVIKKKLCLYPAKSLVQNIGFDSNGTHTQYGESYEASIEADESTFDFPKIAIQESKVMRREWENLFGKLHKKEKISMWTKIKRYIKRWKMYYCEERVR